MLPGGGDKGLEEVSPMQEQGPRLRRLLGDLQEAEEELETYSGG